MFNYPVHEVNTESLKRLMCSGISQNKTLRAANPKLTGLINMSELKTPYITSGKDANLPILTLVTELKKSLQENIHEEKCRICKLPILTFCSLQRLCHHRAVSILAGSRGRRGILDRF